jgi:tRNA(Ile)-lysidine synthase
MIFKSQNPRYTNRFMKHFHSFIEKYQLFDEETPLLVGVSGGVDSMAILFAVKQLRIFGYSNEMRVIHINHATRTGQKEEESLVKEYCFHLGVECTSITLDGLDPNKNFEHSARQKRYDEFYQLAHPLEKIILAHHIDDSFEWTILQTLRSSSIEGLVGIPVVNRRVIRPFMCVTKEQVCNFAKFYDIPFIEDPTNEQIKYERNYIRQNIITGFTERYPKYLKHYVYRHNEIVRRLGLHQLNKQKTSFSISYASSSVLIHSLQVKKDYSGLEELILKGLKHLNPNSRGQVSVQIDKIVNALQNNKYGPLSLTAGYQVYLDFNILLITKCDEPSHLQDLFSNSKKFNFEQFFSFLAKRLFDENHHLSFPFLVKIEAGNLDKRNFDTSFNTRSVKSLRDSRSNYYPALKMMREWSKKKNKHKALEINFLVLDK